jgi:hypothetical protein
MNVQRVVLAAVVCLAACVLAQSPGGELEQGFKNPPDSAKPRVWWHWMNGNVTKEGITADLEWMKRAGIGGFQMFDGNLGVPQFTEKRVAWMTPEWKDAFRHAGAEGPWQVSFPGNWGAPSQITLSKLISWTAYPDDNGVKYLSGTATYSQELKAPKNWFRSSGKVILDLGAVKDFAEISINGTRVGGILWKPPFQADVTGVLKPGKNRIEIKVTNLWPNRMIGDQQPSAQKRYTWTDYRPYTKDSPLLESGLIGPITVSSVSVE